MLDQLYLILMTLLVQGSNSAPPEPKMGVPAPPVGDVVPINEHIWMLALVGLAIICWKVYQSRKDFSC